MTAFLQHKEKVGLQYNTITIDLYNNLNYFKVKK